MIFMYGMKRIIPVDNQKTPDNSPEDKEELPPQLVADEVMLKELLDKNPSLTYDQAVAMLKDFGAL